MPALVTCKFDKDPIKGNWENTGIPFCPLYINGRFMLPWLPQFWSDLPQNLMQHFPHPKDATDKIWLKLANWSWRYNCSKVWMTTNDRALLYYKLILWAFGAGELKKSNNKKRFKKIIKGKTWKQYILKAIRNATGICVCFSYLLSHIFSLFQKICLSYENVLT